METVLVVIEPFAPYQRGAIIDNAEEIAAVLASENSGCVVQSARVAAPKKTSKA